MTEREMIKMYLIKMKENFHLKHIKTNTHYMSLRV